MTPIERGKHRTIVAYLACRSCGHWWGLTPRQVSQLISAAWFTCPCCFLGRTRASATVRDYPDRAAPDPPQLDVKRDTPCL